MKRIILIVTFLFALILPAFAVDTVEDLALRDFLKANMAYRDGKYSNAISDYEAALASGFESGALYYNLGNSYFKMRQPGKAILNYERARKLMPRDSDLLVNEGYVRSFDSESIAAPRNFWQNAVDAHMRFYSVDEMALILLLLLFFVAASHLAGLYFSTLRNLTVRLMVVFCVIFGIYAAGFVLKIKEEKGLSVAVKKTSANFEPSDKATVYFEIPEGQKVKILEQDGKWQKIKRFDGKMGWVPAADIEKI